MKKVLLTLMVAVFTLTAGMAQNVFGKWKTIDDETGEAKSIVEIYEQNGKVYGKVIDILTPGRENAVCENCSGKNKGKPIKGLVILNGLSKNKDEYSGGTILDPQNGKEYKCYISLENADKLKVRGYIGFSMLGRSQYWHRVK